MTTGEFRTLAAQLPGREGHTRPDDRQDHRRRRREAEDAPEDAGRRRERHGDRRRAGRRGDEARRGAQAARRVIRCRSRPPKPAKDADVRVESLDELVEFFIAAGKKGIAINRYKGLGEMNPDTLWETTMDPESSGRCSQVRAEDHTEADLMFTTLMGDQVEPRRKFIEDNALDVKNLDI